MRGLERGGLEIGIFGRNKDTLETITVNNEDIPKIFLLKVVKSIIEIK